MQIASTNMQRFSGFCSAAHRRWRGSGTEWNMYLCAYTAVVYQYAKIGSDAGKWKNDHRSMSVVRDLTTGIAPIKTTPVFARDRPSDAGESVCVLPRHPNVFWLKRRPGPRGRRRIKSRAHRRVLRTPLRTRVRRASSIEIRHTGGAIFRFWTATSKTINFGYPDYSRGENNWGELGQRL